MHTNKKHRVSALSKGGISIHTNPDFKYESVEEEAVDNWLNVGIPFSPPGIRIMNGCT